MKIGIVSRLDSREALKTAKEVNNLLAKEEVLLAPGLAKKLKKRGTPIEEMNADSIITIGGDGTVLYTLQKTPKTPILGINMGAKGFLADIKPEEAPEAIKKLVNRELKIKERERLSVKVSGERLGIALNEGVIRSKEALRVLSLRVTLDGEKIEEIEGDGLIVSTPTGSTAYALSAGGPIVDPRVKAFIAVPLNTHRPIAMPLVYPMKSKLEVELLDPGRKADVIVDGQATTVADQEDLISFEYTKNRAKFYDWNDHLYKRIREKL